MELINPAVIGTTAILKAVARSAPTVKRIVVTSSFAAILQEEKIFNSETVFTEKSWNSVTVEEAANNAATAYRASKTLAERAAWDFVADKSNGAKFDLVTVNPPMVFGPVVPFLASLEAINTSNERIVNLVQGMWKTAVPSTGGALSWVDVRDVAAAHVKAGVEIPEAGGHRLFVTASSFCNRDILDIVRKDFPEYADKLPGDDVKGGEKPDNMYQTDNSETVKILGIKWITLEQSIVDTVKSLKEIGA
jgi:nucleoside-diphosphate-sugar epimerase